MNEEYITEIKKECELRNNECDECPFYREINGEFLDCLINHIEEE